MLKSRNAVSRTLDAQRESAEAYIASQRHENWTTVSTPYDDPA